MQMMCEFYELDFYIRPAYFIINNINGRIIRNKVQAQKEILRLRQESKAAGSIRDGGMFLCTNQAPDFLLHMI